MYSEELLKHPPTLPIKSISHPSERSIANFIRNIYRTIGIAGFAAGVIVFTGLLYPQMAVADWPFWSARAAVSDTDVLLHDPSVKLLAAAMNPDPNPAKGGTLLTLSGDSALISASGIDGTIPDSVVVGGGNVSVYTVREGDSLSGIAELFGVSMNTILWANNISDPKIVTPGTTLVILPVSGIKHTVKSGDTLAGIARKYGANENDIAAYNRIGIGADLQTGTEIIVPGGNIKTAKPAPKKAQKKSQSSAGSSGSANGSTAAISGMFSNPLPGGHVSQGMHGYNGIDVAAPAGTPIYAAAGGTIVVARGSGYNGGYGNYIVIDHGGGVQTLYAHMSSLAVSGGSVGKGSLIGYVGSTGRSTGNHLHFEVRGARNPLAR